MFSFVFSHHTHIGLEAFPHGLEARKGTVCKEVGTTENGSKHIMPWIEGLA